MLKDMLHIELSKVDDWVIRTHLGYFIFPNGNEIEYSERYVPYDLYDEEMERSVTISNTSTLPTFKLLNKWGEENLVSKLQEQGYKFIPYPREDRNAKENLWVLITHSGHGINAKRSWLYYCGHLIIDQWGYSCWTVDQAIQVADIYMSNK